ncbi:siderophore-interacting protein [Streptosporangium sp. KLBMP 9127]|nr:siderophore-interacting protein [Streptosporangium sp. KLBMP 9127]
MTEPYRFFFVKVGGLRRLTPSFLRVTFTGDDLDLFADNGFDQRIKLILPLPEHGLAHLPTGPDWYPRWRSLPDELRNPLRTYTVRAVRPHQREVDVDIVLHDPHGDAGPVARWSRTVRPGDVAALLGPDARHEGRHGGKEFHLPEETETVLLAGDETAVPAITAILERLPARCSGEALLEVPHEDDVLPVAAPAGLAVRWLPRAGAEHGTRLVPAVRTAAERLLPAAVAAGDFEDVDVDAEELWEVPDAPSSRSLYAWLAGEAATIRTLRRHLVAERGMDRRSVAFKGYWRQGRAEC